MYLRHFPKWLGVRIALNAKHQTALCGINVPYVAVSGLGKTMLLFALTEKGENDMSWLIVLEVIGRIISGIVVLSFFLGLFLYDKHPVFRRVFEYAGVVSVWAGVALLWCFTILGGW